MNNTKKRDNFGLVSAVIGIILYIITVVIFAGPLPEKQDTVLIISFVFLPSIIASLIYHKTFSKINSRDS